MGSQRTPPGVTGNDDLSERRQVPITVLALAQERSRVLDRLAARGDSFVIASGETLAAAGLLGLIRVGRAAVTSPDVMSRTPGCECCQIRVDLIDAVRVALLRRSTPTRVIVAVDGTVRFECDRAPASGTSDVDPAGDVVTCVHTLQSDSEVERLARLDGLIVEVDARSASTRIACGLRLWSGQHEAALAIADRIIVTGAELLTSSARSALTRELGAVNGIGQIVPSCLVDVGAEDLVDLDAWSQAPPIRRSSAPSPATASGIDTVVLTRRGVLDPDATDVWLGNVVAEAPSRLFRFQAALRTSSRASRICVRGSRSAMRSQPEVDPSSISPMHRRGARNDQDSAVVLIGRNLDRRALADGFESIEVTR